MVELDGGPGAGDRVSGARVAGPERIDVQPGVGAVVDARPHGTRREEHVAGDAVQVRPLRILDRRFSGDPVSVDGEHRFAVLAHVPVLDDRQRRAVRCRDTAHELHD